MWINVLPKDVSAVLRFEPSNLGLIVKWLNTYTTTPPYECNAY